jgi:hypothetical protein
MAFIVEDGTGVANANSYGTVEGAIEYAADRGIDLSTQSDAQMKAWLVLGTDYLNQFSYIGTQDSPTQSMLWPRSGLTYSDGTAFPENVIPSALTSALYQLVIEQSNGIDVMPSTDWQDKGGFVTMEKVDVLETRYSDSVVPGEQPSMPRVDSLLASLLVTGFDRLRCVRI